MNIQYISDKNGKTTGVFIPIDEWNNIKSKYNVVEENNYDVPEWHKDIVSERLEDYKATPDNVLNWDDVKDKFSNMI